MLYQFHHDKRDACFSASNSCVGATWWVVRRAMLQALVTTLLPLHLIGSNTRRFGARHAVRTHVRGTYCSWCSSNQFERAILQFKMPLEHNLERSVFLRFVAELPTVLYGKPDTSRASFSVSVASSVEQWPGYPLRGSINNRRRNNTAAINGIQLAKRKPGQFQCFFVSTRYY